MNHPMTRILSLTAVLGVIAFPPAAAAQAKGAAKKAAMPASTLKSELLADVETQHKKFSQLATAMNGKYTWRPVEKVRTVSEVLQHVSGENYALPVVLGVKAPAGFAAATMQEAFGSAAEMEKITDESAVKAEIDKSFAHLKQAFASVSEKDMNTPIEVFGTKTTKRGFMVMILTHMHEHLGQMVAYARMAGVAPPWSVATGG